MKLQGKMFIGNRAYKSDKNPFYAVNPETKENLEPAYGVADKTLVDDACLLAGKAFLLYSQTELEERANFLETIADNILALGDELIVRGTRETGLPKARIEGERGRTMNQLKLFAKVVREGSWLNLRVDEALPERAPLPRSDLRLRNIALGPIVVFGASNFPLAFSVAGGDTASALAAGCPVIVKAHSAHPGVSELIGQAIQKAAVDCKMPEGVFSMLYGEGREIGTLLAGHPVIQAISFTGSRTAGLALAAIAQNRPQPIPIYAEMSSINPVFLLPVALKKRAADCAGQFFQSMLMGAGQFCTNPGLLIALDDKDTDAFIQAATEKVNAAVGTTMLTANICETFHRNATKLESHPSVKKLAQGKAAHTNAVTPLLCEVNASAFLTDSELQEEVFGSCSLLVRCKNTQEMKDVAQSLSGQLTATLQLESDDIVLARQLLPILESKAGRILCNGFPTGVEVCDAMVHGGPYPATTDSSTTSVGTLAIHRFLRPVCYQDFPEQLLPNELRAGNALNLPLRLNGSMT